MSEDIQMEEEKSQHEISLLQDEDKKHEAIEEIETERRKTMRRSLIFQLQEVLAVHHEECSESEDDDFEEYMKILSKEKKEWKEEYLKRKSEQSRVVKQLKNQQLDLSEMDEVPKILGQKIDYQELKKKQKEFRDRLIQLKEVTKKSCHLREQLLNYAEQEMERLEKQCIQIL